MRIVLFDLPEDRIKLYPLTLTRPIGHIRVGILRIVEKWQLLFPEVQISLSTDGYLSPKYGQPSREEAFWIRAGFLPNENLLSSIKNLSFGSGVFQGEDLVAFVGTSLDDVTVLSRTSIEGVAQVARSWDIFRLNGVEIRLDYDRLTAGKTSEPIADVHTITYGENIFIEKGASIKAAVLNAENGPIYIGKNAEVQEGAVIRGPFALGERSVVAMGAKIRPDTTVGPFCKVGGEVSNSVIFGFSNKGHDGYLGNAVIGEWCNLGANTNNSNLKNNYSPVKMWDFEKRSFIDTELQFCGLIMGDHSRAGISTMFNTGTTVGVSCNIFGSGFPPKHLPSFSWGGAGSLENYQLDKAWETAELVLGRRNLSLLDEDKVILRHIFEHFSK